MFCGMSSNSSQTRSTLLNLLHLSDNMSSNNVYPAGDHLDGSDPGAKQGGGATNFPLLASIGGGTGSAGHMAASTHVSVVGTSRKVILIFIFSEMSIFIQKTCTFLFEEIFEHPNIIFNTSPFQEDQWSSALEALPTALSPAVDGGACSPPSKGVSMSTPAAGRHYPESKRALEDGEKQMSEGEPDDINQMSEGDLEVIEPDSEKSNILEVSKTLEQGSGFNGFSSIDSSGNLEDINFVRGIGNLQKKVNNMEQNGMEGTESDSVSEFFKGDVDDFLLVKSKAEKKAEKKARQKAEKAAAKEASDAAKKNAKGTVEQPKAPIAAKLSDAEAGKQLPEGNSGKQQAGQKRKKEDEEFDENKVPKLTYTQATKKGLMVEIRCSIESRELDQLDFNNIERILTEVFMEDESCEINLETDIISQGLTQGVVYFSCRTEEAKAFIMTHVRSATPPEGSREEYEYTCFGPGIRPYRYLMMAGVKKELWCSQSDLVKRIRKMNPSLNFETTGLNGERRMTHIRVSTGGKDKEKEVNSKGHFMMRVEVDEVLLPKIIANGTSIKVGFGSWMEVSGGGIEKMKREMSISNRIALVDLTGEEPMN